MGLSLTAEQHELTEKAAAFARAQLSKDPARREEPGEIALRTWRACAAPLPAGPGILGSPSLGGGRG